MLVRFEQNCMVQTIQKQNKTKQNKAKQNKTKQKKKKKKKTNKQTNKQTKERKTNERNYGIGVSSGPGDVGALLKSFTVSGANTQIIGEKEWERLDIFVANEVIRLWEQTWPLLQYTCMLEAGVKGKSVKNKMSS